MKILASTAPCFFNQSPTRSDPTPFDLNELQAIPIEIPPLHLKQDEKNEPPASFSDVSTNSMTQATFQDKEGQDALVLSKLNPLLKKIPGKENHFTPSSNQNDAKVFMSILPLLPQPADAGPTECNTNFINNANHHAVSKPTVDKPMVIGNDIHTPIYLDKQKQEMALIETPPSHKDPVDKSMAIANDIHTAIYLDKQKQEMALIETPPSHKDPVDKPMAIANDIHTAIYLDKQKQEMTLTETRPSHKDHVDKPMAIANDIHTAIYLDKQKQEMTLTETPPSHRDQDVRTSIPVVNQLGAFIQQSLAEQRGESLPAKNSFTPTQVHGLEAPVSTMQLDSHYLKINHYTAKISISPPDLGHIQAEILLDKGRAELHIQADTEQVKTMIEFNIDTLRHLFQNESVVLNTIHIHPSFEQQQHQTQKKKGGLDRLMNPELDPQNTAESLPLKSDALIDRYA